ncbi:hypothetical protein [Sulfitobacter sp. S190]|uniref:hypothetical protein n=1 Tax=Sulfitobacter sp. S190 TaxID=2867022 RepID=UPI0021A5F731|nr:hypothetical protein [Sulfitobacter sp. S190]UWR21761.1 hypothetical protein K3756_13850 [Sulfitobacter sp. S190]
MATRPDPTLRDPATTRAALDSTLAIATMHPPPLVTGTKKLDMQNLRGSTLRHRPPVGDIPGPFYARRGCMSHG